MHINKKIPLKNTKYKDRNISVFLKKQIKVMRSDGINCKEYIKLSQNNLVKRYIDKCVSMPNKKRMSSEDTTSLLFMYCDIYEKIPERNVIFRTCNLGNSYHNIKIKIKSGDNELYIRLSKNKVLKKI